MPGGFALGPATAERRNIRVSHQPRRILLQGDARLRRGCFFVGEYDVVAEEYEAVGCVRRRDHPQEEAAEQARQHEHGFGRRHDVTVQAR